MASEPAPGAPAGAAGGGGAGTAIAVGSPAAAPRGEALPELGGVHWRRLVDETELRRSARRWTLCTAAHTVPFVGAAAGLMALQPLSAPVAVMALAHAWVIPELYARRGANVVRPRPRAAAAAEARALGLLGDLVDHRARDLYRETGLLLERGRLGVWLVGEAGALLVPPGRPPRPLLLRPRHRARPAERRPGRPPAARPPGRRARLRDGGEPRLRRRPLAGASASGPADAPGPGGRALARRSRSAGRKSGPLADDFAARRCHHPRMSPISLTSPPRLLLFPQIPHPDGTDARPTVRRYTLTLLPVRHVARVTRTNPAEAARPA